VEEGAEDNIVLLPGRRLAIVDFCSGFMNKKDVALPLCFDDFLGPAFGDRIWHRFGGRLQENE
jgi:hypothetical protein